MSQDALFRSREALVRSEYSDAIEALSEARLAQRQRGNTLGEAEALSDLAVTYQKMGNLPAAEAAYQEAHSLYVSGGDEVGTAKVLGNLATLNTRRGRNNEARALLLHAAALFSAHGEKENEADTLRLLARLYLRGGQWLEALLAYNRAMDRMTSLTFAQQLLRVLSKVYFRLSGVRS